MMMMTRSAAQMAADTVYGFGEIEMPYRWAGMGYVPGISGTQLVCFWGAQPRVVDTADNVFRDLPEDA